MSVPRHTTVIEGIEYDFTDFVNQHPGGADMILLGSGQDATAMFHSYHRNTTIPSVYLKKLPNKKAKTESERINTPMMEDLKKRVNGYFDANKMESRGGPLMIGKSIFTFCLTYYIWYLVVFKSWFILAPFLGILYAINGLSIQHDANHGAFSKYPKLNKMAGAVDDLIGGSALMWRHQHVIAHHVNPNHDTVDFDTYANYPLLRYNPSLPALWFHQYQHMYAPFLYMMIGLMYPIGDMKNYMNGAYVTLPLHRLRDIDRIQFILGKCLHYGLNVAVPFYFYGLSGVFYTYIVLELFGGLFLASVFAVSHNNEKCQYNMTPDETDWVELQIRTSANWSVGSLPWLLVSGGLNYQIEHHLFPGINHLHYPALSVIVQQFCKDYSLPYNSYPTYTDIYISHLTALKKLGGGK
jgi:fatty acid desaturase (delta-4 desaturase)